MSSVQPAQTNERTENVVVDSSSPFKTRYVEFMDVVRIFSNGIPLRDFSKIFLGVTKSGGICFFPLEIKKTTLFGEIFKIQGALPPFRRPWWSSQ